MQDIFSSGRDATNNRLSFSKLTRQNLSTTAFLSIFLPPSASILGVALTKFRHPGGNTLSLLGISRGKQKSILKHTRYYWFLFILI